MTAHQPIKTASTPKRTGRLFFLEINAGKIHSINPDGSDKKTIVTGARNPDGIAVDAEHGHIYWTNMGVPSLNDGSIERVDLDGGNRTTIIPQGATHTPKQLHFDKRDARLYWGDREGMRIMRSNLDGSNIEILVETGRGDEDRKDATNWCVGVAIDHDWNEIWWTQKGPDNGNVGRLFRAPLELRSGETPSTRTDIELIKDRLPEPIDLEIADGWIYWTDRGDPPRGNTVNRMRLEILDHDPGPLEFVFDHLMEGIGIALDVANDRMFITDLAGSIYTARLDGSDRRAIAVAQGNLTGIAHLDDYDPRTVAAGQRNLTALSDLEF
jgi:sugar lactone lactonase YvrE